MDNEVKNKKTVFLFVSKNCRFSNLLKAKIAAAGGLKNLDLHLTDLNYKKNKKFKDRYNVKSVPSYLVVGEDPAPPAAKARAVSFEILKNL